MTNVSFTDGNGRIGRLWQSTILYNYNKLFELIPTETLVYENQQYYYDAIEESRKVNSSTPFIEYMLEMISKSIDTFNDNTFSLNQIKDEYLINLTKIEKDILNIIINNFSFNDFITADKLSKKVDKANSSIRIYFKKFTNTKILIASGSNKGRKYKLNIEILNK